VARFTFKLEGVLEQRKHVERQRQREVATVHHKLLKIQAELDAMSAVKRQSAAELRSGQLNAAALAAHQRFAAAMRQKASALNRQIDEARRELAAAQLELVEAAKQRKIMEKLRDREHARWTDAQRKRESREAEEVIRNVHQSHHVRV
jgi:flagellar FliJ protein